MVNQEEERAAFIAPLVSGSLSTQPPPTVLPDASTQQEMAFAIPDPNISSQPSAMENGQIGTSNDGIVTVDDAIISGAQGRAPVYYPVQQDHDCSTTQAQQHISAIPATYVPNSIRPPKITHPDFAPPPSQKKRIIIATVGIFLTIVSYLEDWFFDLERRSITNFGAFSEWIEICATLLFLGGAVAGYKTGQWRCLVPGLVMHYAAVKVFEVVSWFLD